MQTFVAEGLAGLEGHWTDRSSRLEIEFLEAVTELHERVDSVIRHLRCLEFRLRVLEGRGENTDPPDLDSLDRWTSSFGLRLAYPGSSASSGVLPLTSVVRPPPSGLHVPRRLSDPDRRPSCSRLEECPVAPSAPRPRRTALHHSESPLPAPMPRRAADCFRHRPVVQQVQGSVPETPRLSPGANLGSSGRSAQDCSRRGSDHRKCNMRQFGRNVWYYGLWFNLCWSRFHRFFKSWANLGVQIP